MTLTLAEKYETKCAEAARWKADLIAAQERIARLEARPPEQIEVPVEVIREVEVPVEVIREVEVEVIREVEVEVVRQVEVRVEVPVPATNIAQGIVGTNAQRIVALESIIGVLKHRLREAGLDDGHRV